MGMRLFNSLYFGSFALLIAAVSTAVFLTIPATTNTPATVSKEVINIPADQTFANAMLQELMRKGSVVVHVEGMGNYQLVLERVVQNPDGSMSVTVRVVRI